MNLGDVVFERGDDKFSGAIQLAQRFLPGEDRTITHALIVIGFGLAIEADPKHGVHFRQFTSPADLEDVCHVMRPDVVRAGDDEALRQIHRAGIAAFAAFLGEKYSFGQILRYKFDRALATELPETLGGTFCSALVKRVLTVAGLAEGLSPTLLMSPSELHAELAAASGWRSVPIEEFGRVLRGPTESTRRLAAELGLGSDLDVAAHFAKANRALIKTFKALVDLEDATGEATLALAGVNLLRNADNPLDMVEEAGIAVWWRELGGLDGRVRWKLAKSRALYREKREELANRLRAAAVRLASAQINDPVRQIVGSAQTLTAASDLAGLRKLQEGIAPLCGQALAVHYASGRDALAGADDRVLDLLGEAMEARHASLAIVRDVARTIGHLLEEHQRP
jgi:hypothetical protein